MLELIPDIVICLVDVLLVFSIPYLVTYSFIFRGMILNYYTLTYNCTFTEFTVK